MKILKKIYNVFKSNRNKMFLIIGVILFVLCYRGIPLMLVEKPHIDCIVPNKVVEGIQFNEDNSIIIQGQGLSKASALYVNGSYVDNYKVIEQTDSEMRVLLPEKYYKSPQKLNIKVEMRINSELLCTSNNAKIEVIASDFILKPEINGVTPIRLEYSDEVLQTITLEGKNFNENSRVFVGGKQYESIFEEDSLIFEIPFYDWCTKKSLSIQVIQSYNGYLTTKKSRMYTINTNYQNAKQGLYEYKWLDDAHSILDINASLCNEGICDIKDIIMKNYLDGQRIFNIKFAFSEDCILYSVSSEKVEGRLPKTYLEIRESEQNSGDSKMIPCTFDELCTLLNEYEDIYIIMDMIDSDDANEIYTVYNYITEHINKLGIDLREQLIVKVNTKESYHLVSEIYPVASVVLELRMLLQNEGIEKCVDFINSTGIGAAILPIDMASLELIEKLNDSECRVYLDGINDNDNILEFIENGAYGTILPYGLDEEYRNRLQQEWVNYAELKLNKIVRLENAIEYLEEVRKSDYICFISVKDDARMGLSEELLKHIYKLGAKLYPIENIRSSYVLISQNGSVIAEDASERNKIVWSGKIDDAEIQLESAGLDFGNYSSIVINRNEYSMNQRGINCVVYDSNIDRVIDSVNIDIYAGEILSRKEETNDSFWLDKKKNDENYKAVFDYLSRIGNERYLAVMAINDDASFSMTKELQDVLNGLGLQESLLGSYRHSYIAVLDSGKVVYEKIDNQRLEYAVELDGMSIEVMSAGGDVGSYANIFINGIDYSQNKRGLNIVVYDKFMKKVLDSVCFDLYADYEISGW